VQEGPIQYVCVVHPNITLIVQGAHLTAHINAKNLYEKIVCWTESETRSLTQCESCLGSDAVQVTLYNGHFWIWRWITYTQWVTTDRSTLMTVVVSCEEFIDDLTDNIWTIFHPHSFIAWHQAQVLTQWKETLNEHKCVVLVHFVENYSFIVQDAV
jgi:hypothetical protein